MTSSAAKIHVLVAFLAIGLCACTPTKPPTDEVGAANRNLLAAKNAGAERYAPAELRAAQDHLSQANAAMSRQDYDAAALLAGESGADSELAAARARLGKAHDAIAALEQQNTELASDATRHLDGAAQP
jgi:hypothetical protein